MKRSKGLVILRTSGNSIDILDTINGVNDFGSKLGYECLGFLDDNDSL